MVQKKYKLGKKEKDGLHRIIALRDFGSVKKGDVGGFVESENNLSQKGNAWVYGNALVFGDAQVSGDALVFGDARAYGNTLIYGNARVYGNAWVFGDALVYGNALVFGDAQVSGDALVFGDAKVYGKIKLKKGLLCSRFDFKFKWQIDLWFKMEKEFEKAVKKEVESDA